MKLKDKNRIILKLKFFFILFIFGIINKGFAAERNFVIATIDRSPITYFDLKQKAKLIYFLKNKKSDYNKLNKYFELSLESLISDQLLVKKAKEFNKNILKLTRKDASKYILAKYKNSNEAFENFLKKNNLLKSVVISNIQIEIIKKYLINMMFEKEYDDYLKEVRNISGNNNDEMDLEQIVVKIDKKNIKIINSIDDQISSLSNKGYSFKEIAKILSNNNLIEVSAGRSGWQDKKTLKSNTFNKLFKFSEGKIIKERFNNNLNYVRIIGKREKGKLSDREQIIDTIRLSYENTEKNVVRIRDFYKKNFNLNCKDFYKKLGELKSINLSYQKINLTNFSEKILLMIKKTDVKQFTDPIIFNKESIRFYICSKSKIKKNPSVQNLYDEKLLMKKVALLTNKILKILKKDAIIDIKIKVNELN